MLGPRHGPRHHSLHRSMHLLGPADAGTNINKHPIGLFSCRPLSGYILVGAPTCKLVTRVLPAQLRGPAVGSDRWDAAGSGRPACPPAIPAARSACSNSCKPLLGYILVGAPTCKLVTRVLPAQLRGPAVGPDRWDAEEQTNKQSKPTFHLKGSEAWGLSRPPIQKNRDCPCAHPHVVRCHRDCGTAVPPAQ